MSYKEPTIDPECPFCSLEVVVSNLCEREDAWVYGVICGYTDDATSYLQDEKDVLRLQRLHKLWKDNHAKTCRAKSTVKLRDVCTVCNRMPCECDYYFW